MWHRRTLRVRTRWVHTPSAHICSASARSRIAADRALLGDMTTETQAARTVAQLREAIQDLAGLACNADSCGRDGIALWAELAHDLADRYHVHVDGLDARRGLRYVAVARNLDIRPYAVVSSDPDEVREALEQGHAGPGAAATEPGAL